MIYTVVVTPEAEHGLRGAYLFIRRDSPEAASRWVKGARGSIRSLSRFPARCPIAEESREVDVPIRDHRKNGFRPSFSPWVEAAAYLTVAAIAADGFTSFMTICQGA